MRKLYLERQDGERVDLTSNENIFFQSPSGLGFKFSNSYVELSDGFYINTMTKESQKSISGTLIFIPPNAYTKYKNFVDWVYGSKSLRLIYDPDGEEYSIDVEFSELQKGEYTKYGSLDCKVSLSALSMWVKKVVSEYTPVVEPDEQMQYTVINDDYVNGGFEFKYGDGSSYSEEDLQLMYGYGGEGGAFCLLSTSGHMPAAMKLECVGAMINPTISVTDFNTGELLGSCYIEETFEATDTLIFSTVYTDSYVKKRLANGTEIDLIDKVSLESEPFFRLPVNRVCSISVNEQNLLMKYPIVWIYNYYRSV